MSERRVEPWQGGGQGGWRVEFYRQRDEAVSYWYGTRQECEARAANPAEPAAIYWLRPWDEERAGYYVDAATATGMYDR